MLRHLLVATDGSPQSARAAQVAAHLATLYGADLALVRVMDHAPVPAYVPVDADAPSAAEDWSTSLDAEATGALAQLADQMRAGQVAVETTLLRGDPAETLLTYEAATHPDLVVMAGQSRPSPARPRLGSVTERLVREGIVPVLLVPAAGPVDRPLRTALLPLDRSPLARAAIAPLLQLADHPLRRVRLLRAIQSEPERADARAYLEQVARQLAPLEVDVQIEVASDPAAAVEAAAADVDLVVMTTHGESGVNETRLGRVADQVARRLAKPLLLARPPELATSQGMARFLSTVPLLHELDPRLLDRLVRFTHQRAYEPGDVIVREGERGVGFFVIRRGQVDVLKAREGKDERLTSLGPGDVFGEIALIEDTARSATVQATEPTTCIAVTALTLRMLMDESPAAMQRLQSLVRQRLAEQARG